MVHDFLFGKIKCQLDFNWMQANFFKKRLKVINLYAKYFNIGKSEEMLPLYAHDKEYKVTRSFRIKEKIYGWLRYWFICEFCEHIVFTDCFHSFTQMFLLSFCRLILSDTNSRNLFLFLLLNLSFAFVELLYGIWTNRFLLLLFRIFA